MTRTNKNKQSPLKRQARNMTRKEWREFEKTQKPRKWQRQKELPQ